MTTFDDEVTLSFEHGEIRRTVEVRDWGAATSIGKIRKENEDHWGHVETHRFAVADGMGGTDGGRVASELIIDGFMRLESNSAWVPQLTQLNRSVHERCQALGFPQAGTTLVALVVEAHRCVTVHIGDSRIYRLRDGNLQLLTTDHNIWNLRLEEGLDPSVIDQRGTPRALTSWIGSPEEPDYIDIGTLSVEEGDRLLLVTDGVSEQLTSEDIETILASEADSTLVAQTLVDRADLAGGKDNSTALVVDLGVSEQ